MTSFFNSFGQNLGLLIVRIGLGASMIAHGKGKMFDPEKWTFLGQQMKYLGIDFAHSFWGFMAAFSEFGGGILLIIGLLSRLSSLLLFVTMVVAFLFHVGQGDDFGKYSHSLELSFVFLGLFFTGAGKYSVDNFLGRK